MGSSRDPFFLTMSIFNKSVPLLFTVTLSTLWTIFDSATVIFRKESRVFNADVLLLGTSGA